MRTFEYHDPKSQKFWNIEIHGAKFTVIFGKVGSGQKKTKSFASSEKAQAAADKLIREKIAKRYIETTPPVATRQAVDFEQTLANNPDDLAGWNEYADYLVEQGSPRGEFMHVQIALEDETRSTAERKELRKREKQLLKKHEREWLGILAPHLRKTLDDDEDYPEFADELSTAYRWRHGMLDTLKVDCLTVALAQALADAPVARFLEKLHIVGTASYFGFENGETERRVPSSPKYRGYGEWLELLGTPLLRSLRVFQMGDVDGDPPEVGWMDNHTYAPDIECLIAQMPRIEEIHLLCKEYDSKTLFALRNLTNLRILRMYALNARRNKGEFDIRIDVLARNPSLGNLTHLMLHPHYSFNSSLLPLNRVGPVFRSKYLKNLTHLQLRMSDMGDAGVEVIVDSGILKRLKVLDLRHGLISDEGAAMFAACADTRHLEKLDLSRNRVSPAGLQTLLNAGIKAVANNPLTQDEVDSNEYLHEGDFE